MSKEVKPRKSWGMVQNCTVWWWDLGGKRLGAHDLSRLLFRPTKPSSILWQVAL